jgi:hypothetical protein
MYAKKCLLQECGKCTASVKWDNGVKYGSRRRFLAAAAPENWTKSVPCNDITQHHKWSKK